MDSLFQIEETRKNIHSCTGIGCTFCAFVDGTQAKRAGTKAVTKDPEWTLRATEWRRSCYANQLITADDLVEACGHPVGSPNQIGALMKSWASKGLIQVYNVKNSERKTNHARRIIVWRVI